MAKERFIVSTDRLLLVPMEMKYLHSAHEYAADPENTTYMVRLPNDTLDDTKEFIMRSAAEWGKSEPEFFEYAIIMNGTHIGGISLYLDKDNRTTAELGWTVNKKYWNQGICTEAAKSLVEYATKSLGITRFIAHCDSENISSRTVMEKLGMVKRDEYGGRYNKQSTEERRECLYEMIK